MVALCLGVSGDCASRLEMGRSAASLAVVGSGDGVVAGAGTGAVCIWVSSGVAVRPSRGARPETAETLRSRAISVERFESVGGGDADSADETWLSAR